MSAEQLFDLFMNFLMRRLYILVLLDINLKFPSIIVHQ